MIDIVPPKKKLDLIEKFIFDDVENSNRRFPASREGIYNVVTQESPSR
jgi:hypothetical protein